MYMVLMIFMLKVNWLLGKNSPANSALAEIPELFFWRS